LSGNAIRGGRYTRPVPVVLIVGPSGVGKSTLAKPAAKAAGMTYVDLDEATSVHSPGPPYHVRATPLVAQFADDKSHWRALDVGAGFQDEPLHGVRWIATYRERMIAVMAEPNVVLSRLVRGRADTRTLEQLTAQEFSSARRAIYDMAPDRLDNNGDIEGRVFELTALLSRFASRPD
jgi:dephospho-CoA kinase